MSLNKFLFLTVLFFAVFAGGCAENSSKLSEKLTFSHRIPAYGNSWVVDDISKNRLIMKQEGITNWNDSETKIRTYFRVEQTGKLNVGLVAKSTGTSVIKVSYGGRSYKIDISENSTDTISVGVFKIDKPGYHQIEFEGVEKAGTTFAEIESILIGGEAAEGTVHFVRDDFYWGQRGPSVHLSFQVPEDAGNTEWFYSEILVPEGDDVIGSYFMANGFRQGYFGIQVNSETERRILFSVWSPFQTDNPAEIPEEERIILFKKGRDVNTREFGNEGSGGQSFLRYNWKAGITYRFLLRGKPAGNGSTDFTAWFFAPETGEWKLIAGFRRPKTDTWLKGLHSFLENFVTHTGNVSRMAYYSNQWICSDSGKWSELTKIKFTADATARKDSRLDYAGGAEGNRFFLKNCGFFSENTVIDTFFERESGPPHPEIDFKTLP